MNTNPSMINYAPLYNNLPQQQQHSNWNPSNQTKFNDQLQNLSAPNFQGSNSQLVPAFCYIQAEQCAALMDLPLPASVTYKYNPLEYAYVPHAQFASHFGRKSILFLGMNPGPYGMAQNGVPFGDTKFVKEFLNINGQVNSPPNHRGYPIHGLECPRSEVSGSRFWGLMEEIYGSSEKFFQNCYVHNYCPFGFNNQGASNHGKNFALPRLRVGDRRPLEEICDRALLNIIRIMRPEFIVGIGKYAYNRADYVIKSSNDASLAGIKVVDILHPSALNFMKQIPWHEKATQQLEESGLYQRMCS